MQTLNKFLTFVRQQPRWRLIAAGAILVILAAFWFTSGGKSAGSAATFTARRGPLEITVLEGGSLQALESQEIKCEVRVGYQGTKILRIVEEGYLVTEEDVRTNKVLCELDSSDLQKQIMEREIQFQSSLATLTDAQQNFEIQRGQNESDVKAAQQKARFARMDFDKYLGDTITERIIAEVGLDKFFAQVSSNNIVDNVDAPPAAADAPKPGGTGASLSKPIPPALLADTKSDPALALQAAKAIAASETRPAPAAAPAADELANDDGRPEIEIPNIRFDFTQYADINALGDGEAKQKLRKLDDDLQVAEKDLGQAKTALEGTQKLFEKGFVPKTEITRDQISHDSAVLKVKSSTTARALFLKYELPRTSEETLSKYAESVRELDKARRVAISKLAQAKARLNSARGQYEVQARQRKDLSDQIEKCMLRAQKTGLVVYGGGRDDWGNQEPIREGATVRERQSIITIPDMTRMAVNVKIHESYIKKVKKGQKARITVDAFPDQILTGEITKVGVLPDSQNRWMNPDMKVYVTTITVDGTYEWVKPGMSAKVEILVNKLDDVVYVPVQAVVPRDGKQYCYLAGGFKPERREVEVGEFTDEFIEVKNGLKEGDRVLLRPPSETESGSDQAPAEERPSKPATPGDSKEPSTAVAKNAGNGKI